MVSAEYTLKNSNLCSVSGCSLAHRTDRYRSFWAEAESLSRYFGMVLADWSTTFATAQKSASSQAAWATCYQVRLGVHLDLRLPGRAGKLCWDCIGQLTAAVNNLHLSPDISATTPRDLQAHMKQVLQCDQACQHEETRVAATACLRLMGRATTGVLECILHHCPQQFTALAQGGAGSQCSLPAEVRGLSSLQRLGEHRLAAAAAAQCLRSG